MTLEGGMAQAIAVEGATDARIFEAYVEGFLAPSLSAGQVVLLDNLGVRKTAKVRDLIESSGAEVQFLPVNSPGLDPIEEAFSETKARHKNATARIRGALIEAMPEAPTAEPPDDARGRFAHPGYVPQYQQRSCVPL